MFETEQLTLKQAALLTGKDEKTIRRWITVQKRLPVEKDRKGRYLVARLDIERIMQEDESVPLGYDEERIAALERRVSELERKLERLASAPTTRVLRPPRAEYTISETQPGQSAQKSTMPSGLVGWRAFSRLHGIGESTTQAAIEAGRLLIVPGSWTVGKAPVKGALDAAGRARFYELYRDNPRFKPCVQCPHLLAGVS